MNFAKPLTGFWRLSLICISTISASAHAQQAPQPGYHYTLPLKIAIEAAQEALRVCEEKHYWSTATVVDMDGVPQVVLWAGPRENRTLGNA
ncbi:hypothetical protein M3I54_43240 [Paraburkholderia sp. CNPSo 3274]|uniref:hypothetical protein n=1 Tax=Paraburkholderia sp. CNPSo 3274 TaxID=2940932 RepID=UPI0020B7C251|nr:hypothetical protein [Paraburkholderia sp. CNPSo 3274]MCP3713571.1 hypothetical protein [Paraburkholderia sp. CNPSo 3274]